MLSLELSDTVISQLQAGCVLESLQFTEMGVGTSREKSVAPIYR